MTFDVLPAEDSDFPRIFELISLAFGHEHPYIEYVYPHHDSPRGRKAGAERMLGMNHADPNTTFIKVVDSDSGGVVGIAKWNVYRDTIPEKPNIGGAEWYSGDEELRDFAQAMYDAYTGPRREAVRTSGGNLVSLDMTVVDPKFQRRNVGRLLVRYGTKIADELGVKTVVEATDYAAGLYAQEGFEIVTYNYKTKLPERFKDWPVQRYHWMERPAQGGKNQ